MQKPLLLIILVLLNFSLYAQIKSVSYIPERNQLNGGLALPSEERFTIRGSIPEEVRMVTVDIHRARRSPASAVTYSWRAPYRMETNQFEIYISDPLRSNEPYTLKFRYYERAGSADLQGLREAISNNLSAYIRANYEVSRRGLQSLAAKQVMYTQLNEIVEQGIGNYAHPFDQAFPGFSDVVRQKIDQTHSLRLRNARFNILRKDDELSDDRAIYAEQLINELIDLTQSEVEQYLRGNLLLLVDIREVENYPSEKRPFYLPLNVGYGGTYFSGDFNNLDYGTAPFIGVAMPLGRRAFTKFLGNASLNTGVMLTNMENNDGIRISGPIVGRPLYFGLGYTMLRILKFNAGAALTSSEVNGNLENVTIYPFIGFSLEFNLWLGLGNR
ncbi:hypothetical protein [Pleomorphovibrio marinus]|uniref:hypothetical protein n=1 Tax=Pleomorphovibrio marinus TaxID=2164132 RepID=UPI000E0A8539|nr:hypothetical protein [Pleomorphovibrio marinus]